jgi:Kdo2-lipid IVA lauroyltransferase/acyltransferase
MSKSPTTTQPPVIVPTGLAGYLGLGFMRLLARLPLSWVRGLGWLMGRALHVVAARRRRIARTNWMLCFPDSTPAECHRAVRRHFVCFVQSWLDRSWLWEADEATVRSRLRLVGNTQALDGTEPTILFSSHFVGLDAGATALAMHSPRHFIGIYAEQVNKTADQWILAGRLRFGSILLIKKHDGLRPVVHALRSSGVLYLLPDMDTGLHESVFVPFFGVPTATLPTLPRLARLGRAKVVPVTTRMTREGYELELFEPWTDYPTEDPVADTARMNRYLEDLIRTMPEQYFWVHKRFKTRPLGQPYLYGKD